MNLYKITDESIWAENGLEEKFVLAESATDAISIRYPKQSQTKGFKVEFVCKESEIIKDNNAAETIKIIKKFKEDMIKHGFDPEEHKWIKIKFDK